MQAFVMQALVMQIRAEALADHLAGKLLPVYLIVGDEVLLVEEACDAVIRAARAQGFSERVVQYAEGSYRWSEIVHESASISLFAERKILDVRIGSKKIDRQGSDIIRTWLDHADGETLLLLRSPRLDANQRKSAWFKAIEQKGAVMLIWDMDPEELPRWLNARMKLHGLTAEKDAVMYLSERVEGNLLAAQQELQKLALLSLDQPLTLEVMVSTLEDFSHFTSFDLIDAVMAGNARRSRFILRSLKEDGATTMGVLMPFVSQLHRLDSQQRLPPKRGRVIAGFKSRIGDMSPVLAECAVIDQQVKGQLRGDPWRSLEQLMLRLSGLRQMPLPSRDLTALVS